MDWAPTGKEGCGQGSVPPVSPAVQIATWDPPVLGRGWEFWSPPVRPMFEVGCVPHML